MNKNIVYYESVILLSYIDNSIYELQNTRYNNYTCVKYLYFKPNGSVTFMKTSISPYSTKKNGESDRNMLESFVLINPSKTKL